jgi:hypothetical protein
MLKVAFSSDDDEVIADAVTIWTICGDQTPPGSFVSYFAKRVEKSRPVSPRLRQVAVCAIEPIWCGELGVSELETIHLLNHLNVDVGDVVEKSKWARLLVTVMCLPAGLENLSPHYWFLLDKLVLGISFSGAPRLQSVEVMRSLEETEDWEKLEVWIVVVWQSLPSSTPIPTMEDVERVTLKSLLQQPPALPRVGALCEQGSLYSSHRARLQQICEQAQAGQLPLKSLPPLYVSVCPTQHLYILTPLFSFLQSINSHPTTHPPFFRKRRHFLKIFIMS